MNIAGENKKLLKPFKHKIEVSVRFNEVDMLGVCNNAVYITYFEEGRIQYLQSLGLLDMPGFSPEHDLFFIVRNEINYFAHARYGDRLEIYTRVEYVGKSSFGFKHIAYRPLTDTVIVDGGGVMARVDHTTRRAAPLRAEFVRKIKSFENRRLRRSQ